MSKLSIALAFRQYIWLADIIYSAGQITREEINRKWRDNDTINPDGHFEIPERTFHNWKQAIQDLFDLIIECDSRTGKYYIANVDQLDENGVRAWLVNTFAITDMMAGAQEIKSQVLFEEAPSGLNHLTTIIEAMRNHHRLTITYQSFLKSQSCAFVVSPYCVKLYKQRWYMLAKSDFYPEPRIYALDRMVEIEVSDEKYKLPNDFDAETYFRSVIGVSGMEELPVKVLLKVYDRQVAYFRTLPLHPSQQEVESSDTYSIFEYQLVPNYEFLQEIGKNLAQVEVLEPKSLREEMLEVAQDMLEMYKN